MPVVASATLEVTPVLAGAQQSLTQQLTGATVEAGDKAGQESGSKFASSMAKKIAVGSAAFAGAVTAVGGALVGTAAKTAAYGDNIDKMSQKLGLSAEAYQKWDYVLGQSGADIDKMAVGMKTLTNKLDEAKNGSSTAQEMFSKLGLSMEELQGMSREEIFEAAIHGFQGMADSTERAALANDLFGKSGQELTPLFNNSVEATEALMQSAEDLGFVMSNDAVKASADFQDSLDSMQRTFAGVKNSVGAQLMPTLTDFMGNIAEFVATADLSPVTDTLNEAVDALADFISNLDITAVGNTFQNIVSGVGNAVGLAWDVIQTVFGSLKDGLSTITAALTDTGTNWGGIWDSISSVVSSVAEIIGQVIGIIAQVIADLIVQAQTQGTFFNAVWEGISAAVEGAGTIIQGVVNFVSALISGDWTAAWTSAQTIIDTITKTIGKILQSAWDAIKSVAMSAWNAIKSAITTPIGNARTALSNAWNAIKATASNLWNSIKAMASSIWQGVKTAVTTPIENLKSALSTAWENIKSTAASAWEALKEKITKPIEDAKDKVKGILDTVKGFFPLSIGKIFSNLKIPTIKVSGGEAPFGIGGLGKAPRISVEWHKKALENPYMFQNATLFGAGEAGDEILYGRENLLSDIREAVGSFRDYNQYVTIQSPTQLNPSEVARLTKNETRRMVMRMRIR